MVAQLEEYKSPESVLIDNEDHPPSWLPINKLILAIETVILVLPTIALFGLGSFALATELITSRLGLIFIALWVCTFWAILGLSISIIAFIFSGSAKRKWLTCSYLGVAVVIVAFVAINLPANAVFQEQSIFDGIKFFSIGVVLFLPLIHLEISLHFLKS